MDTTLEKSLPSQPTNPATRPALKKQGKGGGIVVVHTNFDPARLAVRFQEMVARLS